MREAISQEETEKFIQEGELMRYTTPHNNVVGFIGICGKPLAIVTEYLSGGSLKNYLNSSKPLNKEMQLQIIRNIAAGMLHLGKERIVHKDLAARNVLLSENFTAKVADFGLSRLSTSDSSEVNSLFSSSSIGPLKWMSPESLKEKKFSSQSDVYSFGVTCIEILTRKDPYPHLSMTEFALKVFSENLSLKKFIPSDTSKLLTELISTCLDSNPNQRPRFEAIVIALNS